MKPTANNVDSPNARFDAIGFGEVTCLGVLNRTFPIQSGNCFSVVTAEGRSFKIVNFVYENLTEAIRRGTSDDRWAPGVAWPIQCVKIGPRHAVVHDPRIPTSWYQNEWCECCCPSALLPAPQRLRTLLRRESGEETVTTQGGIIVVGSVTGQRIRLPGDPEPDGSRMMGVLREGVIDTGQTPIEFPSAKVASGPLPPVVIGPPIILGGDARDVPTPGVAAPIGLIYVPEGDT